MLYTHSGVGCISFILSKLGSDLDSSSTPDDVDIRLDALRKYLSGLNSVKFTRKKTKLFRHYTQLSGKEKGTSDKERKILFQGCQMVHLCSAS